MVNIQNSNALKQLVKAAGIMFFQAPQQLARAIVPTIETNPDLFRKINITKRAASGVSGVLTIYTTDIDRDFYLSSIHMAWTSNATADNTVLTITCTPKGMGSTAIYEFRKQTTTANSDHGEMLYPIPILLERNTTITLTNTFTVGTSGSSAVITGYSVDPFESQQA